MLLISLVDSPAFGDIIAPDFACRILINVLHTPVILIHIASVGVSYRSLCRLGTGEKTKLCFNSVVATRKVSECLLLRYAEEA